MLKRWLLGSLLLSNLAVSSAANAVPARIIILRHGEKTDHLRLCPVGRQRALALNQELLGRDARNSVFSQGEAPAAIVGITLHTAELISPTARSWNQPILFYSAIQKEGNPDYDKELNQRTREAVSDVLTNPAYNSKTVVMVWEHRHIADPALEKRYRGREAVTLRQLLHLNSLKGVPDIWPESNYDYFWIVDYPPNSSKPSKFQMVRQVFGSAFPDVPDNQWGEPDGLTAASGCAAQ